MLVLIIFFKLGALCYEELGVLISESGAELIYILRGFETLHKQVARILSFLYSWSAAVILKPTIFGVMCLACSSYVLGPIIGDCGPPGLLVKLGAIVIMCKTAKKENNKSRKYKK